MKTVFTVLYFIIVFTSCIPYRMLINAEPHIGDQSLFPQYMFPASTTPFVFPSNTEHSKNKITLHRFLRKHKSLAFLVIHKDTIVYEYYLTPELKYKATDIFSLSKSFVATTIGAAIQDEFITNWNDTIGKYISELPKPYQSIRIIDLLDMHSGIKTTFWNTSKLYYTNHLNKTNSQMPVTSSSGKNYKYSNQATQLLISVLEKSTQQNFADYFYQTIWQPMHMEHEGYWSMDSKKYHTVRGFAGLCLTARDIAKLGSLYLHNGVLNNQQIIPTSWVDATLSPTEKLRITPDTYYHMHWKILTPHEEFLVKGLFGQYLYINKKTNTIIVRLGFKNTSVDWITFFRHLAQNQSISDW